LFYGGYAPAHNGQVVHWNNGLSRGPRGGYASFTCNIPPRQFVADIVLGHLEITGFNLRRDMASITLDAPVFVFEAVHPIHHSIYGDWRLVGARLLEQGREVFLPWRELAWQIKRQVVNLVNEEPSLGGMILSVRPQSISIQAKYFVSVWGVDCTVTSALQVEEVSPDSFNFYVAGATNTVQHFLPDDVIR
jgi:hypothetical protein